MERVALANGGHRWRVDLCSPRPGCGPFWYSTAELQKYLLGAKKLVPGSSLPARVIPTCFPIRLAHPPPIDGQTWTARSPLVGLTVHVRCAHTMADHVALQYQQRAQGGASVQGSHESTPPRLRQWPLRRVALSSAGAA